MLSMLQHAYLQNQQQHFLRAAFRPPFFGPPRMGPMNGMVPMSVPGMPQVPQLAPLNPMGGQPPPPYLEFRIMEMNQRLSAFFMNRPNLTEADQAQWWNAFAQEFFDDNGFITITTLDRNPESKYTINRILVPRFFRSMSEHGLCDLQFLLHNSVEMLGTTNNFFITALNSEAGEMYVRLEKPLRAEIKTSARYFIEFAPYDEIFGYRIRAWNLELRQPKEVTEMPDDQLDPESLQLKRNGLTICGLPPGVVMFLKMCMVLEPMQVLMNQCSLHADSSPRVALKQVIFTETTRRNNAARQQMANSVPPNSINVAPVQPQPEEQPAKKPPRKRTRKPANENGAPTTQKRSRGKNSNASAQNGPVPLPNAQLPPNQPAFPPMNPSFNSQMYSHEVLVVSEPSMMGNEFGADDERTISRVENAQYDQNSMMNNGMPMDGQMMQPNHGPPNNMMIQSGMNGSCIQPL